MKKNFVYLSYKSQNFDNIIEVINKMEIGIKKKIILKVMCILLKFLFCI